MSRVVREYYDRNVEREWGRLTQDAYHSLEFLVTMRFLDEYLPREGLVLDAGGGPGRYTIELAKKGYDVVLLDLTSACLREAKRRVRYARVKSRVKGFVDGSVVDLSQFGDESFDAVLCLGALSHLTEKKDRESAAHELLRVTRKKGAVFVSVISLYGVFRTVLERIQHELLASSHMEMFTQGIHRAEWHKNEPDYQGFPDAYFFHPAEVKHLFENAGTKTLVMATCEGLSSHLKEQTNEISKDSKKWKLWLDLIFKTCTDPSILGLGEHFLYVGKRI